jgi:hypothetical protein
MNGTLCPFLHFGLIVTGETEREHLPKLFKSLMETGFCHFEVFRFIWQRDPITSPKRKLEIVGSGGIIPKKDATEIGLPARRYLATDRCHLVVLLDDLEHHRRVQAQQVFDRYRLALDTILTDEQKCRAAVHFLVNMLEAYYFADARAVNEALELNLLSQDYAEDVEMIRNPKGEFKKLYPGFDEIKDGGRILEHLDVEHVLSRPDTCAWLRTLFAWCVKALERYSSYELSPQHDRYRLDDGELSPITQSQLDHFYDKGENEATENDNTEGSSKTFPQQ